MTQTDFSNDKYEFMLHTWGGFYNSWVAKHHGKEEGYFFFDTLQELDAHLLDLREIERSLNRIPTCCLVTQITCGNHVRYKTIAKMVFGFEGKSYPYEYDFGYAYPVEYAEYMFKEGNYSCDCNRSSFLPDGIAEGIVSCGHEIELLEFEVLQIKK